MLIIKEEKGRKDGEIFVELIKNRDLSVTDCDRLGYWCDKPHLEHFFHTLASVFEYEELEEIFSKILKRKQKFEPKDGDVIVMRTPKGQFIGILKGKVSIGDEGFPIYAGLNRARELRYNTSFGYHEGDVLKLATEKEKQLLFDKLKRVGKRWNPEKKRIEDIPEEPKIGDWCIFWCHKCEYACVGVLTYIDSLSEHPYQRDSTADYTNAVTWDSTREHLEKVRKGEA